MGSWDSSPRSEVMLTRHYGLHIFLIFAVVGHASLTDRWFGKAAPWWHVGFALILAPIMLVLFGEWIATDATISKWQRRGWGMAALGAVLHLVLDGACLWLPWSGAVEWKAGVAGAAVGATVMALVLQRSWRGFCAPDAPDPDLRIAQPGETLLERLARELALFGGTAFALLTVSLGFVALALVGLARHPERLGKLLGGAGFFGLCGVVAVWMGAERRALLLGRPSPFARLWPRWARRAVVVATQEGLAQLDKNGATVYLWETIAAVSLGEFSGNPALFVRFVEDAPAFRVPAPGRPLPDRTAWSKRETWNRSVQRALTDSDLVILGALTEEGPGVLCRQVEAVLADKAARSSLPPLVEVLTRRKG